MRNRTVRFAVIGCGTISRFHIEAIRSQPDAALTGVFDSVPSAAQQTAERYGVRQYPSYEAVLEDSEVDAVCICAPSFLHAKLAIQAAQAGKHMLIEKPVALTLPDCDRLLAAVEKSGVKAAVVSQFRFCGAVAEIKRALDGGSLGKLLRGDLYMKYYRTPEYYREAPWRGSWEMSGGGALMNQGIHGVDILRYLMGPADTIYAVAGAKARDIEVEDTLSAVVSFSSGAFGVIEASAADYPGKPRRIEINGEKGMIALEEDRIVQWLEEGGRQYSAEEAAAGPTSHADPTRIDPAGHRAQIAELVEAIREAGPLRTPVIEGRRTVEWIIGAYASAESGLPCALNGAF